MDLLVAWIVVPAVLAVLCIGVGLTVEAATGRRLPTAVLAPAGFATVIVAGQFTTLDDATAELTVPLVVLIAVAGGGFALVRGRRLPVPAVALLGLVAVFCVYAAPIVASGEPTLAGYIKLDDTATWLTFTDRIMEHGRDLSGLEQSTYLRTLEVNIGEGYPVGAFVPFGVAVELIGAEAAELIQPYMAFLAVLLGLCFWSLTGVLFSSAKVRAAIVFVACQPALLYGYYLWGGIKEISAAALVAAIAVLAGAVVAAHGAWRALVPLALASAALVGVLSPGGLIWILPLLVVTLVLVSGRLGVSEAAARAGGFAAALGILCLPVVIPGSIKPPTSSPLSDDSAQGNLLAPLDPLQAAGIWPVPDFRLPAEHDLATYGLIAIALSLLVYGVVWAFRRGDRTTVSLVVTGIVGCTVLVVVGSPWVEGKSLATVSPLILFGALVGAGAVGATIRPLLGLGLGAALAAGVVWSNALGYGGAMLAPHGQFKELARIGEETEGEGPALMTEYSPYGARHFLREADPESISELRYRLIPLLNGRGVRKGLSADTDEIDPAALVAYRSLVLRRSPAQSRPPSAYELEWQGEFYELWQRDPGVRALPERIGLGDRYDPIAEPNCARVRDLASQADSLVAATGESPVVVPLAQTRYPLQWARGSSNPNAPVPTGAGTIEVDVRLLRPDVYEFWLGESLKPKAELFVDGEKAGEVRHELNNFGQYIRLGSANLDPGVHRIELRIGGADLHPGSAGNAGPIGPLALSGTEAADARLVEVPATDAERLCGQEWDWIEAGD
jgi:hypothetical protein